MDTATRAYSYDSTHIMPLVDDVFNLGSAELGWKGLYMPDTYIKDDVGKVLLRNSADDAYVDLWSKDLYPQGNIIPIAGGVLKSGPTNGDTLLIAANDTTFFTFLTGATDTCTVNGDLTFASGKGINFDTYGIKITDTYIQFGNDTDALGPKLKYGSATQIQVRNAADNDAAGLSASGYNIVSTGGALAARNVDEAHAVLQARDSGVGLVEIARLQGAADPWFGVGNNGNAAKFYNSGAVEIIGASTFTDTATFNGNLIAGTLDIDDDSGAVTLVDMGVTDAPADGTEESIDLKLDGVSMFKLYGKSDGAGAVDERSLHCGAYLKLLSTDTDSAVAGEVWYDTSENVIKYYNGSVVKTLAVVA